MTQGRIFRADERDHVELLISAARQHLENQCNRIDLHRGRYTQPAGGSTARYYEVTNEVTALGITTFEAGRRSLDMMPVAKVAIMQLVIDMYDARSSAVQLSGAMSATPTFRSAVAGLRMPSSSPLV